MRIEVIFFVKVQRRCLRPTPRLIHLKWLTQFLASVDAYPVLKFNIHSVLTCSFIRSWHIGDSVLGNTFGIIRCAWPQPVNGLNQKDTGAIFKRSSMAWEKYFFGGTSNIINRNRNLWEISKVNCFCWRNHINSICLKRY